MMEQNDKRIKIYRKVLRWWCIICSILLVLVCISISIVPESVSYILIFGVFGLYAGGGLLISFLLLISMIKEIKYMIKEAKKYNQYLEDNCIDEAAEEEAFKAYINSTNLNMDSVNFRELSLWLRNIKNSPKDKSKSAWFNLFIIILFLVCLVGFVVFAAIGLLAYAIGSLGLGFACIFLLLIIHLAHKRISTNKKNINKHEPSQPATVIATVICDETTFASGNRPWRKTTRILSTTYLVYLDVAGVQKKAYSKKFYNKGTKVYVYKNKKLKDMVIIDE